MATNQILYFVTLLLSCYLTLTSSEEECSQQNSYLWKVDTQPPIYLFGTMHVPYTKLWDYIPENVKTAFSSCDEVCLELRLSDAQTRRELAQCQLLPSRIASVEDVLSSEMVLRIEQYFEKIRQVFPKWVKSGSSFLSGGNSDTFFNNIIHDWKKKRPIWILMLISELKEENIENRNIPLLDLFMDNAAEGLGKEVEAMETTKEQCRPLNKISNEKVELALRVQLDYLEIQFSKNNLHTSQEKNIFTYRCGDFGKLVSSTPFLPLPPLENITVTSPTLTPNETALLHSMEEQLWNQIVIRRNRRMANSIDRLLSKNRNKTVFIALGAGHYLSESNVIHRLQRKGHKVEHIPFNRVIDGPTLPSDIIQYGDPNSQVQLLPQPLSYPKVPHPTLSPEAHKRIWDFLRPRSVSESPTRQQNHLRVRQSSFQHATHELDSVQESFGSDSNTHANMWPQEVLELFQDQEQSTSGSNSLLHSVSLTSIVLLAILLSLYYCL